MKAERRTPDWLHLLSAYLPVFRDLPDLPVLPPSPLHYWAWQTPWSSNEGRYPSQLPQADGPVRLRQSVRDPLDGHFDPRRSVRPVPSFLHRQAAPGGHRRPSRPVPPEVSDRAGRNAQGVNHGGPAPPGFDAGG